ncbi:MAG: glycine zipper 2TM domain-containing protein [Pseudomonadaceae bacterium]
MRAIRFTNLHRPLRCVPLLAPILLTACAGSAAPLPSQTAAANTPLAVYPSAGQSPEQLDRDRYDCHLWAVQQTHFDPATMSGNNAPDPVPTSPGNNTAAGAVVGGMTGAVLSGPHHGGEGALVGAVLGAAIGAASDASQAKQIDAMNADREIQQSLVTNGYQRALEACLIGRGYSVR